jgi:hypothetical protein
MAVPNQDCEAQCNTVELWLTISAATDQFCGFGPLTRRPVVVGPELFFGVLDVVTVGTRHILG